MVLPWKSGQFTTPALFEKGKRQFDETRILSCTHVLKETLINCEILSSHIVCMQINIYSSTKPVLLDVESLSQTLS